MAAPERSLANQQVRARVIPPFKCVSGPLERDLRAGLPPNTARVAAEELFLIANHHPCGERIRPENTDVTTAGELTVTAFQVVRFERTDVAVVILTGRTTEGAATWTRYNVRMSGGEWYAGLRGDITPAPAPPMPP